jgi:hypothetical protein
MLWLQFSFMSHDIGSMYYIDTNVDLMCSIQIRNLLPIIFNIIIYGFCLILSYIMVVEKQKYKLR